jgi:hypothetical protein
MMNEPLRARFVLLLHEGFGEAHHDLMLETGAALATWRLRLDAPGGAPMPHADTQKESFRSLCGDEPIAAERIGDHRLTYLDYEGPISGGRGEVRRVDAGEYRLITASEAAWDVEIFGARLRGRYRLERAASGGADWTLRRVAR